MDLVAQRFTAEEVLDERYGRPKKQTVSERADKDREVDNLINGEWGVLFPDDTYRTSDGKTGQRVQHIQNFAADSLRDLKHDAAESYPSLKCQPLNDTELQAKKAEIRESIGMGYWNFRGVAQMRERLISHIATHARAFLWVREPEKGGDRPKFQVLDPRACYPTWTEDELYDMLYVETLLKRTAEQRYPYDYEGRPISFKSFEGGTVECTDLLTPDRLVKVLIGKSATNSQFIAVKVREDENRCGVVPVAHSAEWVNGRLTGVFDQAAPTIHAQNRIVTLMLADADRRVFAERFERGVLNATYGPEGVIELNDEPGSRSEVGYVQRPTLGQDLFQLGSQLERSTRGTVIYPPARSGEVRQSIASGSFVDASMGERASGKRWVNRHLCRIIEEATEIAFSIDEHYMDEDKPLTPAVGTKRTYRPSEDLKGNYEVSCISPSLGLDPLNQTARAVQLNAAGILPKRMILEQLPDVVNPLEAERLIALEESRSVITQEMLATGQILPVHAMYHKALLEGKSRDEALMIASEAPPVPQGPTTGNPEGRPETPVSAEEQQAQLEGGAPTPSPLDQFAGMNPPALPGASVTLPGQNTFVNQQTGRAP